MSPLRLTDMKEIHTQYPLYSVILKQYRTIFEAKRAMQAMNMRMRRLCEKYEKYDGISFVAGASEIKGDTASKKIILTGKRGKPQFEITGLPDKPHVHIAIYGKMSASFCQELRESVNKRHKSIVVQQKKCSVDGGGTHLINYIYQQSQSLRYYGDLDFTQYFRDTYLDDYLQETAI